MRLRPGSSVTVRDGLESSTRSKRSSSTPVQSREKMLKFTPLVKTVAPRGDVMPLSFGEFMVSSFFLIVEATVRVPEARKTTPHDLRLRHVRDDRQG